MLHYFHLLKIGDLSSFLTTDFVCSFSVGLLVTVFTVIDLQVIFVQAKQPRGNISSIVKLRPDQREIGGLFLKFDRHLQHTIDEMACLILGFVS